MERTESLTYQVHPDDEQGQINLMQRFHWNLLNTQTIKTIDNHLEQRGDSMYSVTKTEHYVKLTFNRSLETPHLNEIRELEKRYNSLPVPQYPALFPVGLWLWVVASLFYGLGIAGWLAYFFLSYKPKKADAERIEAENRRQREQILSEVDQLD